MITKNIEKEKTKSYLALAADQGSVTPAEMLAEKQQQVDDEVHEKMLTLRWWLHRLIQGVAGCIFLSLGAAWWLKTGIQDSLNGTWRIIPFLVIFALSIASSNFARKIICKLIGVKEIG